MTRTASNRRNLSIGEEGQFKWSDVPMIRQGKTADVNPTIEDDVYGGIPARLIHKRPPKKERATC
jgi:hypothetical protein